jgi:hypothetical protein
LHIGTIFKAIETSNRFSVSPPLKICSSAWFERELHQFLGELFLCMAPAFAW